MSSLRAADGKAGRSQPDSPRSNDDSPSRTTAPQAPEFVDPLLARVREEEASQRDDDGSPSILTGRLFPDGDWAPLFFRALLETNLLYQAAAIAGVTQSVVFKRRQKDELFAEVYSDYQERSTQILEQVATRRAVEGSDTMLIFLLKSRRPAVYRENLKIDHEHSGTLVHQVTALNGQQPVAVDSASRRQAARLLLGDPSDVIEGQESPDGD